MSTLPDTPPSPSSPPNRLSALIEMVPPRVRPRQATRSPTINRLMLSMGPCTNTWCCPMWYLWPTVVLLLPPMGLLLRDGNYALRHDIAGSQQHIGGQSDAYKLPIIQPVVRQKYAHAWLQAVASLARVPNGYQ